MGGPREAGTPTAALRRKDPAPPGRDTVAPAETESPLPGCGHARKALRGGAGTGPPRSRDQTGQIESRLQMNSPMWSRKRYSSPGMSSYIRLMPSGEPAARNRIRSVSV